MLEMDGKIFVEREGATSYLAYRQLGSNRMATSISCFYEPQEMKGDIVEPELGIELIYMEVSNYEELVGKSFMCDSFETCEMYGYYFIYKYKEPLQNIKIDFIEINENRMHILAKGVATIDGDEDPVPTIAFTLDEWINIEKL